jgi:protein-L-isoaspartate(D-aspartate) O-methyltransferase
MIPDSSRAEERARMVAGQIEARGIHDPRVLAALHAVPRHHFISAQMQERAYEDLPLPIGLGQTISQPYMVAAMTHLLALCGDETVLEIGCGSGYQAAVLGLLAARVHTIEYLPDLAERAAKTLTALGIDNVFVHTGDGSSGWPPAAPYAGIVVTAAAPSAPEQLLGQLAEGGRLVIPVGGKEGQNLQVWTRRGETFQPQTLFAVSFVPLRGQSGWSESDWQSRADS